MASLRFHRTVCWMLAVGIGLMACSTEPRGPTASPRTPSSGAALSDDASSPSTPGSTASAGAPPTVRSASPQPTIRQSEAATLRFPPPGSYVYRQSGFEEFCRLPTACERIDLPAARTISSSVDRRSSSEAVVIGEGQVSQMRFVRDTMRFSVRRAVLTEAYVRFRYGSAEFENSYRPSPPVEVLRLPLTVGARWSGAWDAETAGNYSIEVVGRESLDAAGARRDVFRIVSHTVFRGDVEGRQDLTVWIDSRTLATTKAVGSLDARSLGGRYRTRYEALLRSAPI